METLKDLSDRELAIELRKARVLKDLSDEELETELRKARAFDREWTRRDAAKRQAEHDKRQDVTRKRVEAKKEIAAEWNRVLKENGLKLRAEVSTNRWTGGIGDPEIWISTGAGREKEWAALIERLKK